MLSLSYLEPSVGADQADKALDHKAEEEGKPEKVDVGETKL